jgi:hypothetical protein
LKGAVLMVCDDCLKNFENKKTSDRSRGTCIICGKEKICNQIKRRQLIPKKSTNAQQKGIKKAKCS